MLFLLIVLYLFSTSNHNPAYTQQPLRTIVLYLFSTSNHNQFGVRVKNA